MSKIGVTIDGRSYTVDVKLDLHADAEQKAVVNGESISVILPDLDEAPNTMEWMIVGGRPYEIVLDPNLRWIKGWAGQHRLEVRDLEVAVSRPISGDGRVKAPIPGLVTRILVAPGEQVTMGQRLLILEAMKMENEIRAPRAGQVTQVNVKPGQNVTLGYLLAEIT